MFLIDTNILAAEILQAYEQDPLTKSYLAFYTKVPLLKRVIPDFILAELETLMTQVVPSRYNLSPELKQQMKALTATYMGRLIDEHTLVTPTVATIKEAFPIYQQNLQSHYISLTDSLLLALARQNDFTIVSKDERLNARAEVLQISYFRP
jgi:predicted nucleic acid-binding protein